MTAAMWIEIVNNKPNATGQYSRNVLLYKELPGRGRTSGQFVRPVCLSGLQIPGEQANGPFPVTAFMAAPKFKWATILHVNRRRFWPAVLWCRQSLAAQTRSANGPPRPHRCGSRMIRSLLFPHPVSPGISRCVCALHAPATFNYAEPIRQGIWNDLGNDMESYFLIKMCACRKRMARREPCGELSRSIATLPERSGVRQSKTLRVLLSSRSFFFATFFVSLAIQTKSAN